MENAAEKVGLPVSGDCNNPNAPAMGFFHLEATIDKKGRRISAFKAYLSKEIARERRHRLSVCKQLILIFFNVSFAVLAASG